MSFERLLRVSLVHSAIYGALLLCAIALGNPEPATFILGLSHGLIWIGMSLLCLLAVRRQIIPLRVAVAVVVLGCVAPFFGSIEFLRTRRTAAR